MLPSLPRQPGKNQHDTAATLRRTTSVTRGGRPLTNGSREPLVRPPAGERCCSAVHVSSHPSFSKTDVGCERLAEIAVFRSAVNRPHSTEEHFGCCGNAL